MGKQRQVVSWICDGCGVTDDLESPAKSIKGIIRQIKAEHADISPGCDRKYIEKSRSKPDELEFELLDEPSAVSKARIAGNPAHKTFRTSDGYTLYLVGKKWVDNLDPELVDQTFDSHRGKPLDSAGLHFLEGDFVKRNPVGDLLTFDRDEQEQLAARIVDRFKRMWLDGVFDKKMPIEKTTAEILDEIRRTVSGGESWPARPFDLEL